MKRENEKMKRMDLDTVISLAASVLPGGAPASPLSIYEEDFVLVVR